MPKEVFRLVRFLPVDSLDDCDYLVSCEDGRYEFSTDARDAKLFDTWEDFVAAAYALWLSSGPVDIMFERVFTLPRRAARYA